MSAVERLVNQYEQKIGKNISSVMVDEIKQAKEMEKEQRIKDIDFGHGTPSWANINYEAYFKLSNKSENEAEKLPTFELTEEGEIDGIKLDFDFDGLSPKEKAKELVEGYYNQICFLVDVTDGHSRSKRFRMLQPIAIRCALTAVDEVLKLHKKVALNTLYFYVEVRKEILNYKKPE